MAELSPAAQAVLDATMGLAATVREAKAVAAAALRAAVRQVKTDENLRRHYAAVLSEMRVIDDILAIATELENHQ